MIVLIDSELKNSFLRFREQDVFAARIVSDYELYGCNFQFALFYLQIENEKVIGIISKVDEVVTYTCSDECFIEEAVEFIRVIGCKTILCDKVFAKYFSSVYTSGDILLYNGTGSAFKTPPIYTDSEALTEVYDLICSAHHIKPDFSLWFTDMARKLRHHKASLCIIKCDDRIVSCAFSWYLSPSKVMISGVSTQESYRKNGYAWDCINKILADNFDKTCYVFTESEEITFWYEKMGFIKKGFWCEINE